MFCIFIMVIFVKLCNLLLSYEVVVNSVIIIVINLIMKFRVCFWICVKVCIKDIKVFIIVVINIGGIERISISYNV